MARWSGDMGRGSWVVGRGSCSFEDKTRFYCVKNWSKKKKKHSD